MTTPAQPAAAPGWALSRVLLVAGAALFTVASLAAGGVISEPGWVFGFGGFAAWVLSGAVP